MVEAKGEEGGEGLARSHGTSLKGVAWWQRCTKARRVAMTTGSGTMTDGSRDNVGVANNSALVTPTAPPPAVSATHVEEQASTSTTTTSNDEQRQQLQLQLLETHLASPHTPKRNQLNHILIRLLPRPTTSHPNK